MKARQELVEEPVVTIHTGLATQAVDESLVLRQINELTKSIKSAMEQMPDPVDPKYPLRRRMPLHVMNFFSLKLFDFIGSFVPPSYQGENLDALLYEVDAKALKLPPVIIEIYHCVYFLNNKEGNPWIDPFIWEQIKHFALEFHIQRSVQTPEVVALFSCLFARVIPNLPHNRITHTKPAEFGVPSITTLGSYWYNNFIVRLYKDKFLPIIKKIEWPADQDYKQSLTTLVTTVTDPYKQFLILEGVAAEFPNEDKRSDYINFLATLAKNGIHAAAAAIIACTRSMHYPLLVDGQLSKIFSEYRLTEIYQWLVDATKLDCEETNRDLCRFTIDFTQLLSESREKNPLEQINEWHFESHRFNAPQLSMAMTMLNETQRNYPQFYVKLKPLSIMTIDFLEYLSQKERSLNPMYALSKEIISDLGALASLTQGTSRLSLLKLSFLQAKINATKSDLFVGDTNNIAALVEGYLGDETEESENRSPSISAV